MTEQYLVSTEWLADRLDVDGVRILDVSGFHTDGGVNGAHDDYVAAHVAFNLARIGHPSVRVYDGSLQEWAADTSLPMSTAG